jgi:hypothetical protein
MSETASKVSFEEVQAGADQAIEESDDFSISDEEAEAGIREMVEMDQRMSKEAGEVERDISETASEVVWAAADAAADEVTESLRNETISDEEGDEVERLMAEADQRMSEEAD